MFFSDVGLALKFHKTFLAMRKGYSKYFKT